MSENTARELAIAARALVNAPLPEDWHTERPFWVAARNMRAVLSMYEDETGIDGETGRLERRSARPE